MNEPVINILDATWVADYRIALSFDDGSNRTIDFRPFLSQSRHPDIRSFLDQQRFRTFRVEHGNLLWGDYALCFPVMDLYEDRLLKHSNEEATA
jgi:hypothetical protein